MIKKFWLCGALLSILSACGVQSPPPVSVPATIAVNLQQPATLCPVCPTCPAPEIRIVTATISTPSPAPITSTPVLASSPAPTLTSTPAPKLYTVQPNSPVYLQNYTNPTLGCSWTGVGGQVFDQSGKPVVNLVVMVDGELNGKRVEYLALTGLAPAYGSGGYEIKLGSQPFESNNSLKITLYDSKGNLLSQPFPFNTYNNCQRNQIIVNFIVRTGS